jgi:hypothetical protein
LSLGLGLFPLLPMLPACGGGRSESATMPVTGMATPPEVPMAASAVIPQPAASAAEPAPATAPAPAPAVAQRQPASVTGVFQHPGLLVTEPDFARIRAHIAAGEQPWTNWWNKLSADRATSLTDKPNPLAAVYRADNSKFAMYRDIQRAWCLALRWKLSDDVRYADKAVETLDAWASTLQEVGTVPPGSTAHDDHTFILLAGMQGHQWAQSAEIMRTYSGWAPASLARFQDMLLRVFASISQNRLNNAALGSHANWDMSSLCGAMAIGVFCDRPDLYRLACDYYAGNNRGTLKTFGNGSVVHGVYYMHPGHFGQWEESGRDQGHSTLGMSLGGDLLEMAWNQGDDLYGLHNNRFLSAAEYVARSNLLDENGKTYAMPYAREHDPSQPHTSLWTQVNQSFQHGRNAWEPIYNHYVNRMGLAAPHVARMVAQCEPNYWSGNGDDMVFPTLAHRRAAYAGPMKPASGLTAHVRDGRALLSWWGSVGAQTYVVKRSATANGLFTPLATLNAGDLLTYTDAPPDGVWFYQVTATGSGGASASSNTARAAVAGEPRLSMPLNGASGAAAVGTLYRLDGGSSTVEGRLLDGATWGEGRLKDKAVAFDGKSAGLQLPAGIFNGLDDFSMSLWAYANSLRWDSCMFFAGQDGFSFMRLVPKAGVGLRFAICGAGFNDEQALVAPGFMPIRRWVHVAVTLRGTTGRLYLDGKEVARVDDMLLSPRQIGDQVAFLGRDWNHASFDGRIQGLRVDAGALSAAEIEALAQ